MKQKVHRGFDDEMAVAPFTVVLIERYCREKISGRQVEQIFADTPALKTA